VFVDDVDNPMLADADRHHLERSLRVRRGDPVVVSDGRGRWRAGTLGGRGVVETTGDVEAVEPARPEITIAFALTKGERPELVVQKLTEVGVDRIVPFAAARSVVRWDANRATANLQRLRRVVREAAMQCRRAWLPEIAPVATFETVRTLSGAAMADLDGGPPTLDHPTVVVGPEGGWSDEERVAGLPAVGLGPHVLRAETAAIAAGVLLVALRTRLIRPAG
jgi:16S rRNA (uracil1498-N3)-methyltransferase